MTQNTKHGLTLGELGEQFRKAYGLDRGRTVDGVALNHVIHDSMHVMTGFGIGGVNEARINCLFDSLRGESLRTALENSREDVATFVETYRAKTTKARAAFAPYETNMALFAQSKMNWLDEKEIGAIYELGQDINKTMLRMNGRRYVETPHPIIAAIPFDRVDFTARAQEIRAQFENARNRRIERVLRNILEQEAIKKTGESLIPPHGVAWTRTIKGMGND